MRIYRYSIVNQSSLPHSSVLELARLGVISVNLPSSEAAEGSEQLAILACGPDLYLGRQSTPVRSRLNSHKRSRADFDLTATALEDLLAATQFPHLITMYTRLLNRPLLAVSAP